jgi:uncharacterized membrane protein
MPGSAGAAEAAESCGEGAKCVIYGISELIDYAGVAIIAIGAALGLLLFLRDYALRREPTKEAYDRLRTFLGRSLLLGLEFLVAGDIIKTVAVAPSIDNIVVLAIIVLVRTILSISTDVEIDGYWPWDASRLSTREGRQNE